MNRDISGITSNLNKTIHPEQFDQVVEAILAGKYSWACVLMLRFSGYNPLHYIPYRTYNRLLKENSQATRAQQQQNMSIQIAKQAAEKRTETTIAPSCLSQIKDLAYLDVARKKKAEIRGGSMEQWLSKQVQEYQSIQSELQPDSSQDFSIKCCEFN